MQTCDTSVSAMCMQQPDPGNNPADAAKLCGVIMTHDYDPVPVYTASSFMQTATEVCPCPVSLQRLLSQQQ